MSDEITVKQATLIAAMVLCRDIPIKWNSNAIDCRGEINRLRLNEELGYRGCKLVSVQGGYHVVGLQ